MVDAKPESRAAGPEDDAQLERHEHDQDGQKEACDRRESDSLDEGHQQPEGDGHECTRDEEEGKQGR